MYERLLKHDVVSLNLIFKALMNKLSSFCIMRCTKQAFERYLAEILEQV